MLATDRCRLADRVVTSGSVIRFPGPRPLAASPRQVATPAPAPPIPRVVLPLLAPAERRRLVRGLAAALPVDAQTEPELSACIAGVLGQPGSMVRAQVAWAVGRASGLVPRTAEALAVAVELFHTASLVFDDLPAMDDARERRGVACPHVVWGEATATLAGLALINRGYGLVWQALAGLPARRARQAAQSVEDCLGLAGLINGQARDLAFARSAGTAAEVMAVAGGKSVPLLRLALELPALVGGRPRVELDALARLAVSWGLAYQALDDCADLVASASESGKTPERDLLLGRPNLVAAAGVELALATVDAFLAAARRELGGLGHGLLRRASRRRERAAAGLAVLVALEQTLEERAARLRGRLAERAG